MNEFTFELRPNYSENADPIPSSLKQFVAQEFCSFDFKVYFENVLDDSVRAKGDSAAVGFGPIIVSMFKPDFQFNFSHFSRSTAAGWLLMTSQPEAATLNSSFH